MQHYRYHRKYLRFTQYHHMAQKSTKRNIIPKFYTTHITNALYITEQVLRCMIEITFILLTTLISRI